MKKYFIIFLLLITGNLFPQTDNSFYTKQFERITDSIITNTLVPGLIVGVWDKSKNLEWTTAKGFADTENKAKMTTSKLVRIGSNTKTYVNTVLLQLVQESRLSLDDKLSLFYPEIPNSENVSIRMLSNMRSGIFNYTESDEFGEFLSKNPTGYISPAELVHWGVNRPYYFSPGTGFHYSNTNTVILGMIIEKLTGNSLEKEIQTRILDKLNLKNTYMASDSSLTGDYAHGYGTGADSVKPLPDYTTAFTVSWAWAAGAMVSNLYDVKTYVEALTDGSLLSPEMQAQRKTFDKITPDRKVEYGLGWYRYDNFIGHNGGIPGYSTIMMSDPDRHCTIIVFYNAQIKISVDELFLTLSKVLYPELPW